MKWNDGPEFISELTDPWAPHPVVNRHVCNGGGSSTSAPNPPDYSNFISNTSGVASKLQGYGQNLYDWATNAGTNLSNLASTVSTNAGNFANWATGQAQGALSNFNSMYGPLVQAQVKNATDFMTNLPQTMESWAGKYGADAATSIDQAKATQTRKLQGEGLDAPSIGTAAIDSAAGNQRALAITSASEQGRMAAQNYGNTLVTGAEQGLQPLLGEESGLAGQGAQYGNLQMGAPESAISTTAGAYQPYLSSYSTAAPYSNAGLTAMQDTYQNQLGQMQANQNASSGSFMSTALPMIAGLAGSALLPGVGTALGAGVGSMMGPVTQSLMGSMTRKAATGGVIQRLAPGGIPMAGRTVPAALSPSGGAHVDDVNAVVDGDPSNKAAINTGEFIMPRTATEWYGEKFMQNLVAKAHKERQEKTVAAPQAGPPPPGMPQAALNVRPPMMGAPA
jgi:hypothetical protein